MNLGLSGRLTRATIGSPLTPLFLLASLVVGLIAVVVIPREEEPQISVPMVDIRVNADGLRGPDAVELVTKPLEAIVKGIDGVEHVYSQTEDDRVMVTARFLVGTKSDDAILRVHEKIRANLDRIPVGIPEPLIVGRGINDVAVTVLTLSPKPEAAERWTDKDLYELADKLRSELMKVDSIGLTYISGGARPADQGRAGSGEAVAVRRHAAAARRQGEGCQSFVPGRPGPRRRHRPQRCGRPDACRAFPISACC